MVLHRVIKDYFYIRRWGDIKLVKQLLAKGADVNQLAKGDRHTTYSDGEAPFFCAASYLKFDIVELLIEAGKC